MRDTIRVTGKSFMEVVSQISQSILSIALIILFSKWFHRQRIKATTSGCIIVGNGPSLQMQLDEIRQKRKEYRLLSLNDFPFSGLFEELQPEYYTLVDPYYWFQARVRWPERTERLMKAVREKVKWQIDVLVPYEMRNIIESDRGLKGNSFITTVYFNRTPVSGLKWFRHKLFDWMLGMPTAQNVLVSSIYLMIVAGYKEVIIYGADHSWHENILVSKDNVLRVREPHFKYELDSNSISDREQFFDPVYKFSFDKDGRQELFKVHDLFAAWSRVFAAYWILKEYSDYRGAHIINRSAKSYIDAFDRE